MEGDSFQRQESIDSLIWRIHEGVPRYPFRESDIQNVLFKLRKTSPSPLLDELEFYWDIDGMTSDKITNVLRSMHIRGLLKLQDGRVSYDRYPNLPHYSLNIPNEALSSVLHDFSSDPCNLQREIFKEAPYAFMYAFRIDFIRKLGTYLRPNQNLNQSTEFQCPSETVVDPEDIKRAIYNCQVKFPMALDLLELDDLLSSYLTNCVWLLDYQSRFPLEHSLLQGNLLLQLLDLGYHGIWQTFLLGYRRTHGKFPESARNELEGWDALYKQHIQAVSDACQELESKILNVVREYLPTDLTEKQQNLLELFHK